MTKEQYVTVTAYLKDKIKSSAVSQKERKTKFKDLQRNGSCNWIDLYEYDPVRFKSRITTLHILYNEIRNKPSHAREDYPRNNYYINELSEEIKDKLNIDLEV